MTFRLLFFAVVAVILYFAWRIAELKLKSGATLENVSWRMFWAAIVADGIYKRHGGEAIITEGADTIGRAAWSKHHRDPVTGLVNAVDLRTHNVDNPGTVARELRRKLGPSYDVVLEKDHIHVEYDPKIA